jgi:hypothetical protein
VNGQVGRSLVSMLETMVSSEVTMVGSPY